MAVRASGSRGIGKAGPGERGVPHDSLGLEELRAAVRSLASDLEQLYRSLPSSLAMHIDISFVRISA